MRQINTVMEERGVDTQLDFNSNELSLMAGTSRYKPQSSNNMLATCAHVAPSTKEEVGCSLVNKP